MYSLAIFLLVFLGALFCGAVLAYPLYYLCSLVTEVSFTDTVITATQISGLIIGLIYIKYTAGLNLRNIGLSYDRQSGSRTLLLGFIAGLGIILALALILFTAGIYELHPDREYALSDIVILAAGAVLTGLAVGLFEEILFRGALLKGLLSQSNVLTAIIATALVYAAVHFIAYTEPEHIGFSTAPGQFISAYSSVLTLENYDAFLSLFILGVLLGLMRINTGHILQCISLHAGLVAGIKLFRYFAQYQTDSHYRFLVNEYDFRLGFAALGLLSMVTLIYLLTVNINRSHE